METDNNERSLTRLGQTFGSEKVGPSARRRMVRDLFDRVAPRYDLMNDLMSFGLHRLWKRRTAEAAVAAAGQARGPLVDLAGGTGDLGRLIAERLPGRPIVNADASPGMLAVAARRGMPAISLVAAEAEALPFADDMASVVTLGFGLRNMTDPPRAIGETFRILGPGGSLVLLEFSRPAAWFSPLYDLYSRLVIPLLGAMVAGDRGAYRYLVESIGLFPDADSVTAALRQAGFADIRVKRLMFGVAALHIAVKP